MAFGQRFGGLFGTAFLAAAIALGAGCSSGGSEDDDEICDNGTDDDGDGDTDCDDSNCTSDPACTGGAEVCDNDVDDDGDGDVDCDDSDCAFNAACVASEICDNGVDDDGDTDVDCADADCAGDAACTASCTADADYGTAGPLSNQDVPVASLPDGLVVVGELNGDPDGIVIEMYNGYGSFTGGIAPGTYTITGDELNYATCGLCVRLFTEAADDGYMATGGTVTITSLDPAVIIDLSGMTFEHVTIDGTTFESTPHSDGCTSALGGTSFNVAVPVVEICDNSIDDDEDGDTDCDDADCAADPACTPTEICNNTIDDDGDGDVDCDDADCAGDAACGPVEICDNTIDDDSDGDVDCDDADCAANPACAVCTADADYGDPTLTGTRYLGYVASNYYNVTGVLNADDDLRIELYNGYGALSGGIAPGTYVLAGEDLDYATCGLCVRLFTEEADGGYFATGGTVEIASVDPLVVNLSGMTLEHVEIDPSTFESTPHADGCTTELSSATFDLTGASICTADADYGAATVANQVAEDRTTSYVAAGTLNDDPDYLVVALWDGYGAFSGGVVTTGTYSLTGDELDAATCGICVQLITQGGDDGYLATGGSVTITSLSPLQMDLSGVSFEHVVIDDTTGASTPHADGCTSALTSASFDVTPTTP